MRVAALVVTLGLVLAAGCGGDDDPAPAPPPQDGGGGGGDGGTGGGSGGGGDGGDAGGGARLASNDGTVTFERLHESAECDVLVPARMPDAVAIETGVDACAGAFSDGSGHVAVAAHVSLRNSTVDWDVFTLAGASVGIFRGEPGALVVLPEGFQTLRVAGRNVGAGVQVDVLTYSGPGLPRRTERATPPTSERTTAGWDLAHDPLGGSALVHFGTTPDGRCSGAVSRFDETGAPRGSGTYGTGGECRAVALAVSGRGEALVVEEAEETAWLWWIAPGGGLARPPSPAGSFGIGLPPGQVLSLRPLLDGSVVASEGGVWTRRVPHLGDGLEPAPEWLSSRPGYSFENTRGARGYALIPPQDRHTDDCSKVLDLVAPSGRLCGRVTLTGEGGSCGSSFVSQGWDGTVIQQRLGCRIRFWPRLLAGD